MMTTIGYARSARYACLALTTALLLSPAGAPLADDEAPFTARGNEPFWNLTIGSETITLVPNIDAEPLTFPTADAEISTRYVLQPDNVVITVTQTICADTMSGMPFPLTVSVERGDETLSGCGGEPASLLKGPEWSVRTISGEDVLPDIAVTIHFGDDGIVSGSATCNRFTGPWTLSGEGLAFGSLATTRMACIEPQDAQERRFLDALASVSRFDISADGELVLLSGDTPVLQATR